MSFLIEETSVEGGSPVELYEIAIGSDTYYLASGEESVTYGLNTYDPISISRSEIAVSDEDRTQLINFELPATHPFVRRYISIVPGARATLSIYRFHRFDGALERVLFFKGTVRSVAFSKQGELAKLAVMPLTGGLGRSIPRFTYQGLCNHIVYDARCKVNQGTFTYAGNVSAVSGSSITVDGLISKGAGWAVGGFITDQLNQDYRLIIAQSGDVVTVLLPFPSSLAVLGESYDVIAGCDHTLATCKTKFDNVINYGGFMFVPLKDIFRTGLD